MLGGEWGTCENIVLVEFFRYTMAGCSIVYGVEI